ncbi:putative thiopurine S-methyltransferase [Haemaphysalis longicornis]
MDMGHSVVGVEFVEDIVREYFSENDLQMEETTCPAVNCKVLQTPDRRLRVFICSIYKFKRECAGLFDIVWDRSGFTAIRDVDRARYAAVLKSLLAPGFSYGMWTLIYDAPWYKLNPRSADETALRKHYGDVAKVTLVDSYVVEQEEFLKGGGPVTYCIWHLTA